MTENQRINTKLIHAGISTDRHTGSVNIPIYQTSTYQQEIPGVHKGYEYSRTGNPTREALESQIAELESGNYGFAFASGLAAMTAVLSLFRSGDRIVISDNVYGGTYRLLDQVFSHFQIGFISVDTTKPEQVREAAGEPGVKALYIETPTNPLLKITDLEVMADIAKEYDKLENRSAVTAPTFQFMRVGFFCLDCKDSTADHIVFNRTVSLKDSFKK